MKLRHTHSFISFCKLTQGIPTTPHFLTLKQEFRVTHPFHPFYQQEFKLLRYRKSWGKTYIDYSNAQGDCEAIPLEWTNSFGGLWLKYILVF